MSLYYSEKINIYGKYLYLNARCSYLFSYISHNTTWLIPSGICTVAEWENWNLFSIGDREYTRCQEPARQRGTFSSWCTKQETMHRISDLQNAAWHDRMLFPKYTHMTLRPVPLFFLSGLAYHKVLEVQIWWFNSPLNNKIMKIAFMGDQFFPLGTNSKVGGDANRKR